MINTVLPSGYCSQLHCSCSKQTLHAQLCALPSNLPNPFPESSNIVSLHQLLNSIPFLRQLLQARNPMHETMTGPTQPSHIVQLILGMPASLQDLLMHAFRY